jgi:peptidoglycan hydrolase-like protein with peptidoglycan-binding domain
MTYHANPRHYGRDEFKAYVDGLSWDKGWRPKFPTLHNTGVPSLAQWLAYGATAQERWGAALNHYYQGLGWHAGPHLVCCPDYIWVLCDPEADGVSVSCWNRLTFGIEMVGNFEVGGDDPKTGEGAKVIDNAVFALAALSAKLGWSIGTIVKGVGGLHFHRECARDGHPCPGALVNKADILSRVLARVGSFGSGSAPPATPPAPPPCVSIKGTPVWIQMRLNQLGAQPPLALDGDLGPASRAAIESFQLNRNLDVDGVVGPQTLAALSA